MTNFKTAPVAVAVAFSAVASLAHGQTVRDCDRFEANARNLMMPPEEAVRTFANGDIRFIGLDTLEPACCFAHLLVTYWLPDEGVEECALVSDTGGLGFAGIVMADIDAAYDPSTGLTVTVPAGRYDGSRSVPGLLSVTINRATGKVGVVYD